MLSISNVAVGVVLLIGMLLISLISILPIKYIETYTLQGRKAVHFVSTIGFIMVVFFWWIHDQQTMVLNLANNSIEQSEKTELQVIENQNLIEDIERVRDDSEYTACLDRNVVRQLNRSQHSAVIAQAEVNLTRIQESPLVSLSQFSGYSEIQDSAVIQVFIGIDQLLAINREEAIRISTVELLTAQAILDEYIEAEPFEQCGDDPIPNEEPVRPPITAAPQQTVPVSTTSSTTTTTMTLPVSTTVRPQQIVQVTTTIRSNPSTTIDQRTNQSTTVVSTEQRINPPTTVYRPGNAGGNGNGNVPSGGNNGNGNGNR